MECEQNKVKNTQEENEEEGEEALTKKHNDKLTKNFYLHFHPQVFSVFLFRKCKDNFLPQTE